MYTYRFMDDRVGKAAQIMRFASSSTAMKIDAEVRYIQAFVDEAIGEYNPKDDLRMRFDAVHHDIIRLFDRGLAFFMFALSECEAGRTLVDLEQDVNRMLAELETLLENVKDSLRLLRMNTMIDGSHELVPSGG